jgi:hypothetical protein
MGCMSDEFSMIGREVQRFRKQKKIKTREVA